MNKKKFSELAYDVFCDKSMLEEYPELKKYKEFSKITDSQIRFAALVADIDNPLYKSEMSFQDVMKECASLSKCKKPPMDNLNVNDAITKLFMFKGDKLFEYWFSVNMAFHNLAKVLRQPIKDDDKNDPSQIATRNLNIADKLDKIASKSMQAEAQLFKNSTHKKAIMKAISASNTQWAEKYAMEDNA